MRFLLAFLMILHGAAHLPGFVNEWRLANLEGIHYRTTILAGRLDLGDAGIRVVGALWLAGAIAFWVAGAAALGNWSWWIPVATGVALGSLLLSLLELPEARIGAIVNLVILAGLFIATRFAAV
jgi:hypothetical protein